MNRRIYLTIFTCAFLVLSLTHSLQALQLTEPDFAAIDAYVETQMREGRIPGVALGITRGNQIVHLRGFGVADPSGQPVTPQTPFIIASLSKSFTALAIMQLVEEGKIELDVPVQRYIPWFSVAAPKGHPDASTRITVRHLLYQTSGIPNSAGLGVVAGTGETTLEQRIREMNSIALAHLPGTTFVYSSANYMLLGLLVQTVSGQSYEAYVRQHIFTPLATQNSFVAQSEAMQHGMATGYRWWFGVPFPADLPYLQDAIPAGYIISSAEDMAHFLMANLNEGRYGNVSVLSPAGVAELHRPAAKAGDEEYYGMGWVIGSTNGTPILTHGGDAANFYADMVLVPGEQWGIIVLTNAASMLAPLSGKDGIAEGVTKLLLGRQPSGAGLSFGTVYLIVDVVVLLLTALLIRSIVLLPQWRRQLVERRPRLLGFLWRVILPTLVDLAWPLILLILLPMGAGFPLWQFMALFQPDLTYWLMAMALVTLAQGITRPVLAFSAFRRAPLSRLDQADQQLMNKYAPTSWIDPRIEVRTSPVQGQGMFAAAPIKQGEIVVIWGGQLFTEAEIAAGKAARGSYSVIAEGLYLGTAVEEGKHPDDFMNHACDPNVWLDDAVTLVARRAIAAGAELTVDYALWEADEAWVARWTCQCGSPRCRQVITGQDWRLPALQVRYRQHFSPFINERIRKLSSQGHEDKDKQ